MFGWIYGKVPADQATVPLCEECNSKLGTELEGPVRTIFNAIESGEVVFEFTSARHSVNLYDGSNPNRVIMAMPLALVG